MRNHHEKPESMARSDIHRHAGGRWAWLAVGALTLVFVTLGGCDRSGSETPGGEPPPGLPEPSLPPQDQANEPPSQPAAPQAAADDPTSPTAPKAAGDPQAGPVGEPSDTAPEASVSQDELETFAKTQAQLTTLRATLVQKAQQAGDSADMQKLQAQMQQGASEIVQASELSPERYSEIVALVKQDPELQQQIQGMMGQPGQPGQ